MIISLGSVALLVAAIALMTWLSGSRAPVAASSYGADIDFLETFSLKSYRPMVRLASRMDKDYLASIHGLPLARCYRRIQRNLLREYLHMASKDFGRLYAIANVRAARATSDAGNLSMALLEDEVSFIFLVWGIEARLMLDSVLPGLIDLKPVVRHIETLADQTRELGRPQLSYHVV